MVTYLVIGLVVLALVIVERAIRLKIGFSDMFSGKYSKGFVAGIGFGLIVGYAIDVVIWPIVIVIEIIEILKKRG